MVNDLTRGSTNKVLLKFTIPLFISVVFQQLYSIADSVIAGRFAGEAALAAVGASYPITNIFNAVAVGCNIGCSVVISQLFGAREYKKARTAITTSLIASVAISAVLMAFGIVFTPSLLRLVNTPDDIFSDSGLYLGIYIGGFLFLFLYNIANGIFTSLGNSKIPLYFLIFSSVFNVILDYVFVVYFKMGVAGVAWATFIAQGVAGVLAVISLWVHLKELPNEGKAPLFSMKMLKRIARISIPSVLQQSFVSIGNIFIQSIVNSFGSSVIAGYSAAIKLNTFSVCTLCTFGNAVSAFTAQNMGAKKIDRIKKGFRCCAVLCIITSVAFSLLYVIFNKQFIGLFMESGGGAAATEAGTEFLKIVSPFFCVLAVKIASDGVLRGEGNMKSFMIATFSDLIIRVVLAYILSPIFNSTGIWLSWPLGWVIGSLLSFSFYRRVTKKLFKTVEPQQVKE